MSVAIGTARGFRERIVGEAEPVSVDAAVDARTRIIVNAIDAVNVATVRTRANTALSSLMAVIIWSAVVCTCEAALYYDKNYV